ncbi:helix-turn-helix domain-containing protein [Acidobacteriota bacterium]
MDKEQISDYFSERLKTARIMAGLSMEDLAQKMGGIITKQAIGKYEKGQMKPGSEVLGSLAEALGVKPEFFLRRYTADLSHIEFRKDAKLLKKAQEILKYKTIEFLERYMELEHILGMTDVFHSPFKQYEVHNLEDAERAARQVREDWDLGLSPIINILELLEEKGIKVLEVDAEEDFDGLNARVGSAYVMVINKNFSKDHIRLTAAHELAHILCDIKDREQLEKLCFAFAGAFLLPREVLEKELIQKRKQITLWELGQLKRIYGISLQAILYRAVDLDIISQSHHSKLKKVFSHRGWKKKEPVEYIGEERSYRFMQLLNYAVAEKIVTFSKAAELANMALPDFKDVVQVVV